MNKNEKKALFNFLLIYTSSTILLIAFILYIYFQNEMKSLKDNCNMELSNASMKIKTEILDSYMKNKKYIPSKLMDKHLKYALYDKDKKLIFSYLDKKHYIDLKKNMYSKDKFDYYVETLNDKHIPIKYIVLETCKPSKDKNNLKIYIIILFISSIFFVAFIGYLLSKILLKPLKQRVEHLNKFIKDSAHELNTPVSVLMTSVSMLKNGKNPEKMMRYILSSSKQISQLYNDIHFSAFNEISEDVCENFDLKDLVSESVEFFQDISITKNINILAKLDSCNISMDRTKTQKIINNLISNAIKYSNVNSEIKVTLEKNVLSVQDFGIGISQEQQKEIFKRYKRGNNIEGGFGIGLDIVKRICQEYNLDLKLESKINKGSVFFVKFENIATRV